MVSVVIPVYNEVDTLAALHGELDHVASERGLALDVIFVDDGSTIGRGQRSSGSPLRTYACEGFGFGGISARPLL